MSNSTYRYSIVNNKGTVLSRLPVVMDGGKLELSQQAEIKCTGSISRLVPRGAVGEHILIEGVLNEGASDEQSWPLGTLASASPISTYDYSFASSTVEMYDKLLFLTQDVIDQPYYLPKGTLLTGEVVLHLDAVGVSPYAVTSSTKELASSMTWPAGTTRLRIINDLLDAADYFSLFCDPRGVYRAEPYRTPSERGVAWRFVEGKDSLHVHGIQVEEDDYFVPNRVVAVQRTDGTEAPLRAVAVLDDPNSPYSHERLGRWRTEVVMDVEAMDHEDLTKKANRKLRALVSVARKVTIKHAHVPATLNSVVYLDTDGVTGHFVVTRQTLNLKPGALMTSILKEVVWE